MKKIIALIAAALLSATLPALAQSATNTALKALIADVNTKLKANQAKAGQLSEVDLAPELKRFDALIAAQKAAKSDDAAEIIYMEAMLYLQVLDNSDKGAELMADLKNNYAETKFGKNAAKVVDKLATRSAAKKTQDALASGLSFPDFFGGGARRELVHHLRRVLAVFRFGVIVFQVGHEFGALVAVVQHLQIKHGFHVNEFCGVIRLGGLLRGDQCVEALEFWREVSLGQLAGLGLVGLQLRVDVRDERLERGVGGGLREGGQSGGQQRGGDEGDDFFHWIICGGNFFSF